MKRYILPILATLLSVSFLQGQGLRMGIWASGGVANLGGFSKSRLVAEGGLVVQHGFSDHFGLTGNLGYALKGGMEHFSLPDQLYDRYEEDQRTTLHYANLDISAYYAPIPRLQLGIGPYLAARLAGFSYGVYEITNNGVESHGSYRDDIGFQYQTFDFGAQASIQWNVGNRLGLNLRFRQGLMNAYHVDFIPLMQRNQSLTLGAVVYLN